ncbi:MAG: SpoIIE family protein phosphatase [Bacteroidales bacterium]|nr:SpoIIE family protein phosphatase [Bacteroidales bacterium]
MRSLILTLAIVMLNILSVKAQNFNLKIFNSSSGLPQNYVYSVIQDPNGYIWVATGEGLSRYDGRRFSNFTLRDSLADVYISKLIIDTDGRLWCGHGNGSFSVFENDKFSKIIIPDADAPITDMCVDDKGNIWAVEQNNGLIKITPDKIVTTYFDREKLGRRNFLSIRAINSLSFLVGTSDGMLSVKIDVDGTLKEPTEIEELPYGAVNCINEARDGRNFWVGYDDGQIFLYSLGNKPIPIERCDDNCSSEDDIVAYNIRSIFEDESGNLYLGTWGNGLKEWKSTNAAYKYNEVLTLSDMNGLGNNYVRDILLDREGIFWFATYGNGVVAWINNYFAQYNLADIGLQRNKVISSAIDGNDLWLGLNNGVVRMNSQCVTDYEYYDYKRGVPQGTAVTAICFDTDNNRQYIATDNAGVYYRNIDDQKFVRLQYDHVSQTNDKVNGMIIYENKLYLATQGGFIIYDIKSQSTTIYTTNEKLPHNNINFVYVDPDGQVWIGPKDSGIATFDENGQLEIQRLSDRPINIAGMTIDRMGRMWLATANDGIICAENDSIIPLTTADGLEKNYCYGIAADGNDRLWVCHQPGLSSIDLSTGTIRHFNSKNGIEQEFLSVNCDENGDLWFAASSGLVHYIAHSDKRNSVPPIINLTNILISGKKWDKNEPIVRGYPYRKDDEDKFEFEYVGISMKNPESVRYEYWLQEEGKAEEWIDNGNQTKKLFDRLGVGNYIVHIRAINEDGEICRRPLEIPIHIDTPFWDSIWFWVVLVSIVLVVGRVITKMRERKLKQRQKELEDEVSRQTALLNKQKIEIERKNEDIMDSINYAKRIQTAILPSRSSLEDFAFDSSFILFMPRDVVSGDFYWFNKFDNKILICCGDCTGHGVPGAFMSMIGTTILNDSTRTPELRSPAQLLYQLDKEVKSTLNKNQTVETQDGMDCAIIEIDMDTYEVRSAAARRPIYYFINGRLVEQKGTRRSIGDHRNGNDFIESTTQLHKGDRIYMTSDGFTDQFGGDIGDKYTAGALKRFIESIIEEPMYNQQKMLEQEFKRWKGRREQIDDVIIMGIKL